MKPITPKPVKGLRSVVLGEDNPDLEPLPILTDGNVYVSLWKLSWAERVQVLLQGRILFRQLCLGEPMKPFSLVVGDDVTKKD